MYLPGENELDSVIQKAWLKYQAGDTFALDEVYDTLMPFCLRVSSKTCGRYINGDEEEANIARWAVVEALEKFNPSLGSFRPFLGRVVRNRIIDYQRKERKQKLIPFSLISKSGITWDQEIDDGFFEGIIEDLARKQEINKFKELLAEFDINFEDLVKVSPRQAKSRESANWIASIIVDDNELSGYLTDKKQLPIRLLEEKWQVNRKIVDRYRKYIIAAVLIQRSELTYIKSFIFPFKGGISNGS